MDRFDYTVYNCTAVGGSEEKVPSSIATIVLLRVSYDIIMLKHMILYIYFVFHNATAMKYDGIVGYS